MKKRLYRVTETYYVLAESEVETYYVSIMHHATDREVEPVEALGEIEPSRRDSIPFCDNSTDRTCRQIMEEKEV